MNFSLSKILPLKSFLNQIASQNFFQSSSSSFSLLLFSSNQSKSQCQAHVQFEEKATNRFNKPTGHGKQGAPPINSILSLHTFRTRNIQ